MTADVLLIAVVVLLANLNLQAMVSAGLIHSTPRLARRLLPHSKFWGSVATLDLTLLVILLATLAQMAIWAVVFVLFDQFATFDEALYHSMVNFTTLGYGDIGMDGAWRLMGPIEALNGGVMVSLAAARIYATLDVVRIERSKLPSHRET